LTTRLFFALSLLMPVGAAVAGHFLWQMEILEFMFLIGGVPYLLVAITLAVFILRARALRRIVILSGAAPFAYGLALGVFMMVVGHVPESHLTGQQYTSQFISMAGIGCFFACCYVGIAWALWALGRKLGWVVIEFAG
jgi:hypothetical protein